MTREELNHEKQQQIENEEKHEKRKKVTLFFLKVALFVVIAFLGFYLYTTYISTSRLIVKEKRIVNEKLPENFSGLKLVQFSDLHYGTTVFYDELKRLVKQINLRKPDIVVFTGDLIDRDYKLSSGEQKQITQLLGSIDTRLGKYAVLGEEDNSTFRAIMKQSDFIVLENEYDLIYNDTAEPILLVGLGSSLAEQSDISKAFSYFDDDTRNKNIFTIGLMHEPDTIDEVLARYSVDLVLAGHSHNGNVRIPYIGAISKSEGALKYDQAYYRVNDTDLYVSSGVGTNGPGFRLFCRPSINFFRMSEK